MFESALFTQFQSEFENLDILRADTGRTFISGLLENIVN